MENNNNITRFVFYTNDINLPFFQGTLEDIQNDEEIKKIDQIEGEEFGYKNKKYKIKSLNRGIERSPGKEIWLNIECTEM